MKVKGLLSGLLCMAMLVGALAIPSSAAQTIEIEDTYYPAFGRKGIEDFVSITATGSIKEGGLASVGDFMTYHTYADKLETYLATGAAKLTVGTPMAIDVLVCYANSWSDLRANKKSYLNEDSIDYYKEAVYSLDRSGVYVVEIGYIEVPAKVMFAIEVSTDGTPQRPAAPAVPKSFRDVSSGRWSHDVIMETVRLGMFSGTTAPDANGVGTFDPAGTMTRAHFIVVVTRHLYGDKLNDMIAGETWYSNNYDLAVENGIIKRYEFPITDLNQGITRQEMALILIRAAKAQGQKMSEGVSPDRIADYAAIDDYYKDYVRVAFAMGFVSGYDSKGTYGPRDTLTREQGAMVAYRLATAQGKGEAEPIVGPTKEDANGVLTIYQGVPSSRPAKAGDIFVKDNGVKVVLKEGPNGIVGEGQGVAPDQCLEGRWTGGGYRFDPQQQGKLTDSLGNSLQNQDYMVNWSTGEGHWRLEWHALMEIYKMPREIGKEGQISTDPYKLWCWDPYGGWIFNGG